MNLVRAAVMSVLVALLLSAGARPASAQEASSHRLRDTVETGILRGLYVSTPIAHAFDGWTTLKVIDLGGRELNPLLSRQVANPVLFAATKAAFATGENLIARRIAKRSKITAIAALAGLNVTYALLAAHNLRVAESMQQRR